MWRSLMHPGTDHRLAAQLVMARRGITRARHRIAQRPLSITEQLAIAPSQFALEMVLRDADLFGWGNAKTRAGWAATAHVRDCELRGVLP